MTVAVPVVAITRLKNQYQKPITLLVALQTIDTAQQGAFTRAAAADDRDHFPHVDIQIDALQHMVVAVVLLHLINGDERH